MPNLNDISMRADQAQNTHIRFPGAMVTIITRSGMEIVVSKNERVFSFNQSTILAPVSDMKSCTVNNSLDSSGGAFVIEMIYRLSPDGSPFYLTEVDAMDAVSIVMPSDSTDTPETTMLGLVDEVKESFKISANGPELGITITGRGLGAIWEYDLVKYFPNALGLSQDKMERNLRLMYGTVVFDFVNKPAYTAIQSIYEKMPLLDGDYAGKTIRDFIDVGSELWSRSDERVFLKNVSPYTGTVWDFYRQYSAPPLNELWVDYSGGMAFLRMRPPPFLMDGDSEAVESAAGESGDVCWENISTWVNGEPYHQIEAAHIVSRELSKDHMKSYSIFCAVPGQRLVGEAAEYATFPPFIDDELLNLLGTRDLNVRVPYLPVDGENSLVEGTTGTIAAMRKYRRLLYLWNRDNHRFLKGTIRVRGDGKYRPGDKVRLAHKLGLDGYVTGYINATTHVYRYGQPHISSLTLSRVHDENSRSQLYSYAKGKYGNYDS